MSKTPITVNVHMDAKTFQRFALFDTFILRRRFVSPAVFAAILGAFSAAAFLLGGRAEQASLIGTLLLIIALGLPGAYFLHYYLQLRAQVRRLGLKTPRPAYFVTLSDEGVRVVNNMAKEAPLVLPWDQVHAVYRRADALYLYHTENRAFILPTKDASVALAALWNYIGERLPKDRLHG